MSATTAAHHELLAGIAAALRARCPPRYGVGVERTLRVDRHAELRADVVAVKAEQDGQESVAVEDVVLAVEILSPDWTFGDTYARTRIYMAAGVPNYWVIDPTGEQISLTEILPAPHGAPGRHTCEVFATDRPWPVTLDLPALTQRRARLMARGDEPRS
jgi:Uma2 family endonuclease